MNNEMQLTDDEYEFVAEAFICQIRTKNLAAAGCLEEIQARYGVRMAFLAAFALVRISAWSYSLEPRSQREILMQFTYYEEMKENTEAINLYEKAAEQFLSS